MNIQVMDDVKGHHNWDSEVIKITRDNNRSNTEMSHLEVSTKFKNNYRTDLLDRMKSCKEGKKLKTYVLFNYVIKFEPYLNIVKNYNCRRMLSKFRLSSHDLEIERGRYDTKSINPHERYCRYCKSTNYLTVEDEFHFIS